MAVASLGYSQYDRCVAKVLRRALSATVSDRLVTVSERHPCSTPFPAPAFEVYALVGSHGLERSMRRHALPKSGVRETAT